jgi:hypothetical protein
MTTRLITNEDNTYHGKKCTCTEGCSYACKGTCGCEACKEAYSDFLSGE